MKRDTRMAGNKNMIGRVIDELRKQLQSLDITTDCQIQEDMALIARVRYGSEAVDKYQNVIDGIPSVWPDNIRRKLARADWTGTIDAHEMFSILPQRCQPLSSKELRYLGPPTGICINCERNLREHNLPSNVKYASCDGRIIRKKMLSLRCPPCGLNYNFDKFGNRKDGFRFYDAPRDAIVAGDGFLVERSVFQLQASFAQHAWVSCEGFTEAWHDAFNHGKHDEIDRRVWQMAFWWGEVEEELRRINKVEYPFTRNGALEECMGYIDDVRKQHLYEHRECAPDCEARGCGRLWVTDGLWKLQFPHCMFVVQNMVKDVPLVNFPEVCTNELEPGKAFCGYHCRYIEGNFTNVPTGLRPFLVYSGRAECQEDEVDGERMKTNNNFATAPLQEHGGQAFLQNHASSIISVTTDCVEDTPGTGISQCRKDLGERPTLRKMSRGVQVVVRAGGHIDLWTTLYQSESNGQVFLLLITWLYLTVKDMDPAKWKELFLAYDNMCQLTRLRAARQPLPLPPPFSHMWMDINKIIDRFHINNHVQTSCKTDLHPDNIGKIHPDLKDTRNTQAAEQTFVWLGRFKKILCSMPKAHHLFYLHRLIVRRNEYVSKCYRNGKKPVLPSRKK